MRNISRPISLNSDLKSDIVKVKLLLCNNIHFTITLLLSFFSIVFRLSLYPFLVQSCSLRSMFYTIHVSIQSMFLYNPCSLQSMFLYHPCSIPSMFYTIHVPIQSMFLYDPCSYTFHVPIQSLILLYNLCYIQFISLPYTIQAP